MPEEQQQKMLSPVFNLVGGMKWLPFEANSRWLQESISVNGSKSSYMYVSWDSSSQCSMKKEFVFSTLNRLPDSSVSSLIQAASKLTSGRTSSHQKLVSTFSWIDNCFMVTKRQRLVVYLMQLGSSCSYPY